MVPLVMQKPICMARKCQLMYYGVYMYVTGQNYVQVITEFIMKLSNFNCHWIKTLYHLE